MPIRTASLNKQLKKNGTRLHLAMMARSHSQGAEHKASDQEQALLDERGALKAEAAARRTQRALPKAAPAKLAKVVKPAKAPKAPKAAKAPKEAKAAKSDKPSRAVKQAKKAENAEAARKATQKSAKT
ncbi:MAG: hypothetical protein M3R22_11180 [Pseudomonadota bacterium]|nr:hypothetical protein [Pseudomonadota bacterium]